MNICYLTYLSKILSFLIFSHFLIPIALALTEPYDHSGWDQFLGSIVNNEGAVNYEAVKKDPEPLNRYLAQLEQINLRDYDTWPREEKLALWLNAYHAGVIQVVVEKYPVSSIQDIPGVWEAVAVKLGGGGFSLNQIRSEQLIAGFGDEKIHLALACGAKSCPPFRSEAFTGPRVEGQLFQITREFVNDPNFVRMTPGKREILLSRIFKWYAKDFILDFGNANNDLEILPEEAAVVSFVAYYLQDIEKSEFLESGQYGIKYLLFDWELHEWHTA